MNLIEEALRLNVMLCGNFDDGAYGRYDESVYCGVQAYFYNNWAEKTPHGFGNTPDEAIEKLFANVKDKQRLQKMRDKFKAVTP